MKRYVLATIAMSTALLLTCAITAFADDPLPKSDLELVRRYAPVFYFHPAEAFFPQPVDVIVEQARLRQSRPLWFNVNLLLKLDVLDLLDLESDESHFLDVWYGDDGGSAYTNYTAHRAYYEAVLSPEVGGPPAAVYAHVVRDEIPGFITIQYWALYFYNDWFNKHEGDWEMVEVILTDEGEPRWVILSQHHGGTRRAWAQAPVEDTTHPVAYVALGSHANYFVGDEAYPNGKDIGNKRIEIMDRTGAVDRVMPEVILLPQRAALEIEPDAWPGAEWLPFRGHWGQKAPQSDFGGPLGPADKGEQWERPYAWGMAQPLDTDEWYRNRLRVEVVGVADDRVNVHLTDIMAQSLPAADELGGLAMLHADPPATGVRAEISAPPGTQCDVVARWPDAEAGQVIEARFTDVQFAGPGLAVLELGHQGDGGDMRLVVEGTDAVVKPSESKTVAATWDAPDLVWIGGILPAHQVASGVLLAALMGVVPTLVYVGVLYWVDRYEKEPKRMLTTAFVWGAIPSMLMAVAVELFFNLPPDLVGPRALEAVRLGLVAPVLQEALKGIAVLFIAWRYRREFDNVLDGIIYGAMVGFGFAMTGNVISYAGSFLLWGFEGLSPAAFAEGIVYGLDNALYTAAFGASLGLGRLVEKKWQRWALPVVGFTLAVGTHALHNLIARSLVGLSPITIITTLLGFILIVIVGVWSLDRQRRCLVKELPGEIPEAVYRALTTPAGRTRARWRALWKQGVGAWQHVRRLHQLCAELAFKKQQARLWPDEADIVRIIEQLRQEIASLVKALEVRG